MNSTGNLRIFCIIFIILSIVIVDSTAAGEKPVDSDLAVGAKQEQMVVSSLNPGFAFGDRKSGVIMGQSIQVLPEYSKDRLIVRYKTDGQTSGSVLPKIMDSMNRLMGASVVMDFSEIGVPGMQIIRTPNFSVEEAVKSLSNSSQVLYAEPDHLICLSPDEQPLANSSSSSGTSVNISGLTPNDPDFSLLWGLYNSGQSPFSGTAGSDIDAPDAWAATTGSSSVIIAVVDTGVDCTHPDLVSNIWTNSGEVADNSKDDDGNGYVDDVRGWNFVSDDNDPLDDNGHGTHCAGTIAAVGNNNLGVTGVCWKGNIMPLKFLDSSGNGYISDAISAILYANQMGADVISNSWGGTEYSHALKDAIDASSAVVVCAAGNNAADSDTSPVYPAAYTSSPVLSVAATDYNDEIASFSNYGAKSVDIAAPGVYIKSTYPDSQYQYLSGTSMAVPYVSGVAALLKASDSTLSAVGIKEKIITSADSISSLSGKVLSGGRLNAAAALGASRSTLAVSTSQSGNSGLKTSFLAAPVRGIAPLTVQFLDSTSGGPNSWLWNFGDGESSTAKSPYHTYQNLGKYTVTLKTTGLGGVDTVTKIGYIRVI